MVKNRCYCWINTFGLDICFWVGRNFAFPQNVVLPYVLIPELKIMLTQQQLDSFRSFAQQADQDDSLASFRSRFSFPQHEGKDCLYFCGNSLGLQPDTVEQYLLEDLAAWKTYGVKGHILGDRPWKPYHKFVAASLARIVGAAEHEVVCMNTLTTNIHLLMASFYRPTKERYKIIVEAGAFPSDQYLVHSQVEHHGFDPAEAIIEIQPREGSFTIEHDDIINAIEKAGNSLALVFIGGVNYYTGQVFHIESLTEAAHNVGALAGFDLAHGVGNIPLHLHDWNVDFAAWCSYKYLNSGPGGPGGIFIHERHGLNPETPRLAGWWGHNEDNRFKMPKEFEPMKGAEGWQLSNAQILSFSAHRASLDIFDEVSIEQLREKSLKLSSFLRGMLAALTQAGMSFQIITPTNYPEKGAQVSMLTDSENGPALYKYISDRGVICDWREPNVIRVAPAPLYNSFDDVFQFVKLINDFANAA